MKQQQHRILIFLYDNLGDQEINVINMVKGVTKYAKMITEPQSIKQELEKAINLATSGTDLVQYGWIFL